MPIHVDINAILDDSMTFKPEVIRALREFKKAKTFRMEAGARLDAMNTLVEKMALAYGIPPILVVVPTEARQRVINNAEAFMNALNQMTGTVNPETVAPVSGCSYADVDNRKIVMVGKLSVITLLHEFAHIRFGTDELKAQRFAVNLFRKVYPKQFAKLVFNGWAFVAGPPEPPVENHVAEAAPEAEAAIVPRVTEVEVLGGRMTIGANIGRRDESFQDE